MEKKEITGMSRLEFWGGMLAILGITLTCFMHVNDRSDKLMEQHNFIMKEIMEQHKEIHDIKIGQFNLEHKMQEVLHKGKE